MRASGGARKRRCRRVDGPDRRDRARGPCPAAAAAQQAASPVELRVAWWGSQDRHNRTIKAIVLFQKKHPHVKVSYEFAGWSDYWTKMTTQAAGPNLPDVMQQDYAYIAEWSSRGLLAPLDDHVKNGTIDTRNVSEALLKGGVVGGKLVAINLGSNSQCWVIDLDAFKNAGLKPHPIDDTFKVWNGRSCMDVFRNQLSCF